MAIPAHTADDSFCPNCHQRLPDTEVSYEEALFSEMRASRVGDFSSGMRPSRIGAMTERRSQRSITRSGTVMLCSTCAAAYRRCVQLRVVGGRMMNAGAVVMIGFALIYALVLPGTAQQGVAGVASAALMGLGALTLVIGVGMYVGGRLMRRTAARFVGKLQAE